MCHVLCQWGLLHTKVTVRTGHVYTNTSATCDHPAQDHMFTQCLFCYSLPPGLTSQAKLLPQHLTDASLYSVIKAKWQQPPVPFKTIFDIWELFNGSQALLKGGDVLRVGLLKAVCQYRGDMEHCL